MKIFIPTKNRAALISTHLVPALAGNDIRILVHDSKQALAYQDAIGRHRGLTVTHTPSDTFGLTRQREWATKQCEQDEWIVFADDNIVDITGVPVWFRHETRIPVTGTEGLRSQDKLMPWRDLYGHSLTPAEFPQVFGACTTQADRIGAKMVGFATTGNHYFRGVKWREVGYVIGKMMFWKVDHSYRWDHTISMEDFRNTGEHLLNYGRVLIDNFLFPECTHYQPGGMGTYAERVPQRKADVQNLLAMYPGLFRVKNRKHFVENTDLAVRFNSTKQVDLWRAQMGWPRGI